MQSAPLSSVPSDVLLEVAAYLESRVDLLNFSLTSPKLYESVVSALYAKVALVGVRQCANTLHMLNRRPDVARHVQKLIVRPHQKRKASRLRDDCIVAAAVRRVAPRLDALHTFVWDGDDMCPYDDMWFALRISCPRLRTIGTTVGSHVPSMNSHLFDFSCLKGFSVMVRPQFYYDNPDRFTDEESPVYHKFWDMLINRCPNLEELSIEGNCNNPADAAMIIKGHWPKLRKLYLGDVVCDWLTTVPQTATTKRPFIEFLEAHPSLQSLSISRQSICSGHFSSMDAAALPKVTDFEGTFDQLMAIPSLHSSVKRVTFRDPMPTRELAPLSIASRLQGLTSLTSLKIVFVVQSVYDSAGLLRSLVVSCLNLQYIDLTFAQKPSIHLDSFAKAIRPLTKLQSFSLTLVKSPGEETLSAGAACIARSNPGLHRFRLAFVPPSFPKALPFALPVPFLVLPAAMDSATYTVHRDGHGLPVALAAHERRERVWPLGVRVSRGPRRRVYDLRPVGHPESKGKSLLALVLDTSRAGEELRTLIFCAVLLLFSTFVFVRGMSLTLNVVQPLVR